MIKAYLWVNAALYVLFALWCTFSKEQTAKASGYLTLSNGGWSEYLVIYGGLQLGIAGFFAYLAMHAEYHRLAIVFSLLLYVMIVIYRLTSIYAYWPVRNVTLTVAAIEVLLLVGAIWGLTLLQE